MYKAHHWALYYMWFQSKSDLYVQVVSMFYKKALLSLSDYACYNGQLE